MVPRPRELFLPKTGELSSMQKRLMASDNGIKAELLGVMQARNQAQITVDQYNENTAPEAPATKKRDPPEP